MHHPTDRIAHTMAFVTPVVEHWLEREIALYLQTAMINFCLVCSSSTQSRGFLCGLQALVILLLSKITARPSGFSMQLMYSQSEIDPC